MDEQEIIKEFKDLIYNPDYDEILLRCEDGFTGWHELFKNVLDLYNIEKERNKELLEGLKYRVNYCKLLEKELYSNGVNYNMELTKIEQKYLKDLLED